MIPLQLRIKNCFSFSEAELDLNNQGLVLVHGWSYDENNSNGAGKSSLVNKSLCWWLYGKTIQGYKADNILNRHIPDCNAVASGEVKAIDGSIYTITRSRNPNKLKLIHGNKDISARVAADTQKKIDKILGQDFNSFIQTSIFGQGKRINFLEIAPTEQRRIITSFLPIERIKEAEDYTKECIKKLEEKKAKVENEYAVSLGRLSVLSTEYTRLTIKASTWDVEKERKIKENLRCLAAEDTRVESIKSELTEVNSKIKKESDEYLEILKDMKERYSNDIYSCRETINDLEKDIIKAEIKERELRLKIKRNRPLFCPECKQAYPPSQFREWERNQQRLESEHNSVSIDLERGHSKKQSLIFSLRYKEKDLKNCEKEINDYTNLLLHREHLINKLGSKSEELREKIKEISKQLNPYRDLYEEVAKQLQSTKALNTALKNKLTEKYEPTFKHLKYWQKIFAKDLPIFLLNNSLKFITQRTNSYLEQLNNQQLSINLKINQEKQDEIIIECYNKTGGYGYATLSGGEQQVLNFAIGLSLADLSSNQVGGNSSIIVLDEPFENLSHRNAESIINFLQSTLVKRKPTIFLISHNPAVDSLVTKCIEVEKRDGVSTIVRS